MISYINLIRFSHHCKYFAYGAISIPIEGGKGGRGGAEVGAGGGGGRPGGGGEGFGAGGASELNLLISSSTHSFNCATSIADP